MDAKELHKLKLLNYEWIEKNSGIAYQPMFYHGRDDGGNSWIELYVTLKPKQTKKEEIEVSLIQIINNFDLRERKQSHYRRDE